MTRLRVGQPGFDSRRRPAFFLFNLSGSGPHLASYPVGPGAFPSTVKRPGREADYSSPFSAEVKNAWGFTSTPPVRLHIVVLPLHRLYKGTFKLFEDSFTSNATTETVT
jgi:hypothetical protein